MLEAVVDDGNKVLTRTSTGLTLRRLAAGLNISFSAVALGVGGALVGDVGVAAAALL